MIKYSTSAAILAMAAVSAPMVCQGQDAVTEAKKVNALLAQNKVQEAIDLCDKMIKLYSAGKTRVAAQFAHSEPYFHWKKGTILRAAKQYGAAYDAFKVLYTTERFKDKKMQERAKIDRNLYGQAGAGYDHYLTMSLFYMAYSRFQEAQGNPKAKPPVAGDPAKFNECIPDMEEYLKLYQSGKVSKAEKAAKMDGQLCFMLLQAYLLKPEPDFKKAGEYLEMSRKAKAALPDDMAMGGLETIIRVANTNPENIGWVHDVIEANPQSYDLGPVRMARYGNLFFNHALKSAKIATDALKAGNQKLANDAARSTNSLLSMVPDTEETALALKSMHGILKKTKAAVADPLAGGSYRSGDCAALYKSYAGFSKNKTNLEGYALATTANVAQQYGSMRLAKAGYEILLTRYPGLSQGVKEDGKVVYKSMKDKNTFQFAQLCRSTGEEERAVALEGKIDMKEMGEGGQTALLINKMARLSGAGQWDEAIPVIKEVIKATEGDKTGAFYPAARFAQVAAAWSTGKWEETITLGEALLKEDVLAAAAATGGKFKPETAVKNETQCRYFIIDAHTKLVPFDAKHLDKIVECGEAYYAKFPDDSTLQPAVYFSAINALLTRQGGGDPSAMTKDMNQALGYCDTFAKKWEGHDLYPHVLMLSGNILINGEDDARKPDGILALEKAAEAGLKAGNDKGKSVAANSFYMLASYGREIEMKDEDAKAMDARLKGYAQRFWNEADYEGCEYSLKMVNISLNDAMEADKATFDAAVAKAQEVIAREANYAVTSGKINEDMEATINGYVTSYTDGYKKFNGKELTLEQKTEQLTNFPGVKKDDKYTNAILRMAMLTSMSDAQAKLAKAGDKDAAAKMENEIGQAFRRMTNEFKPSDLTPFICVQVGNYEVEYARRLNNKDMRAEEANTALSYFEHAISQGGEYLDLAKLGQANALGLTGDKAKEAESAAMFEALAKSPNQEVAGPALMGITKLHMATGDYAAAVAAAKRYSDANIRVGRKDMQMLYGEALFKSGDIDNAVTVYTNVYQDMGNVAYSAPACKALMEIYWQRNKPSTGDRLQGTFRPSDRWRAWNTAQVYVKRLRESGFEQKMTPDDRDKYNEVVTLLNQYASDAAVQREDKEGKQFQSQIRGKKK
ncbi:MAG: hypothetical protein Q4F35_07435 [Akkermansia sp.]|nr:hypothetical protein [Akkermansia sp.]